MATVTLTYIGRRLNGKSLNHIYIDDQDPEYRLAFSSKIGLKLHTIGDKMEIERTEKGVRGSEKVVGKVDKDIVLQFSLQQQVAIEEYEAKKRSTMVPDGHVKKLIDAVRLSTRTSDQRKKIALYIFDQLTR